MEEFLSCRTGWSLENRGFRAFPGWVPHPHPVRAWQDFHMVRVCVGKRGTRNSIFSLFLSASNSRVNGMKRERKEAGRRKTDGSL